MGAIKRKRIIEENNFYFLVIHSYTIILVKRTVLRTVVSPHSHAFNQRCPFSGYKTKTQLHCAFQRRL